MQTVVMSGNTNPLARQAASFGSVDFLSFLDPGPNGEPLTFAEVMAKNPDWAEQNADPNVAQANILSHAQPLDSSRNPGGGAEPLHNPSHWPEDPNRSPTENALGPDRIPSLGTNFFNTKFSGGLNQICRHPSFNSQLNKDPSFGSVFFQSLMSQKSEDQAMLWTMLGVDPQTGMPLPSNSQPPNSGARENQDLSLDSDTRGFSSSEAQAQAGRLQLENSSPIPSNTLRDSGMLNYQQNPFNGFQRQNTQDQSQFSVPPTSSAILQNSGVGNRGERMDKRIELANSVNNLIEREEGKLIDLEATREGSLNYMLQPSSLRIEPQTPQNPSNPEFGSVGGRGFLPIANNNLTAPLTFDSPNLGFKATTRRGGDLPGNLLHLRPYAPRAHYPPRPPNPTFNPQIKLEDGQKLPNGIHGLQPVNSAPRINTGKNVGGLSDLPPLNIGPSPTWHSGMQIDSKDSLTARTADLSVSDQGNKTKFMTGLIRGITPLVPTQVQTLDPLHIPTNSQISPSTNSEGTAQITTRVLPPEPLPKSQQSLPSLPKVPSIEEYQRSLTATAVNPKFSILPLQGLPSQGNQAAWALQPQVSEASRSNLKHPNYAPLLAPLDIIPKTQMPAPTNFQPRMPEFHIKPQGVVVVSAPPKSLNGSNTRCPNQPQNNNNNNNGARALRKRSRDDLPTDLETTTSQGANLDSEEEADGRKELRKAKNRASAAASRARREAYTASLEIKVKKLQNVQAWLLQTLESRKEEKNEKQDQRPKLSRQRSL